MRVISGLAYAPMILLAACNGSGSGKSSQNGAAPTSPETTGVFSVGSIDKLSSELARARNAFDSAKSGASC